MKQIWLIILAAFLLAMSLSPHVLVVAVRVNASPVSASMTL